MRRRRDECVKCGVLVRLVPSVTENGRILCQRCVRLEEMKKIKGLRERFDRQQALENEIMSTLKTTLGRSILLSPKKTNDYSGDHFHLKDDAAPALDMNRCQKIKFPSPIELQTRQVTIKDNSNDEILSPKPEKRKGTKPTDHVPFDRNGAQRNRIHDDLMRRKKPSDEKLGTSASLSRTVTPKTKQLEGTDKLQRQKTPLEDDTRLSASVTPKKTQKKRFCNQTLCGEVTRYDDCIGECPRCSHGFPRCSFIPLVALNCGHFYHRECLCDAILEGVAACETCGSKLIM